MMHVESPVLRSSPLNNAGSQFNLHLNNVNHQHHCSPSWNGLHPSRLCPHIHDNNHFTFQGDHDNDMSVLDNSLKLVERESMQRVPKIKEEHVEGGVLAETNPEVEVGGCKFSLLSYPQLKRKRPAKLNIPKVPRELKMVGLNEKIVKEESSSFEGDHYGFYCNKGKKENMEDAHKIITNINGDDQQAFFGVYDGHGGRKAADFVAEKLGQKIVDLMIMSGGQDGKLEKTIKDGYLATDNDFLEQGVSSGVCCVTALIKDGCLAVGNAGDCRAVLSRSGNAEVLTCDHKPGTEKEKKRIENLGGYVGIHGGVWRVQGTLAVSRSIGDLHLKQWVTAEPDTRMLPITSECEFMIMASDGLWEKVSSQEAVDIARPFCIEEKQGHNNRSDLLDEACNENSSFPPKTRKFSLVNVSKVLEDSNVNGNGQDLTENLESSISQQLCRAGSMAACKKLVELSVSRGALDDISVMVVDLRNFCRRKTDNETASNKIII
ncbi:hypothetical protein SUGI_0084460 [Cryptomeria japonica]|nr:hypothetical protein SUGI_0084460 [Cryptomeria japonica]